jgi:flagellin-like protein
MRDRKAVSPVIATLLLIAIAVAASVVMYSWVNTMVANQAKQSQTAIRIEQVRFPTSTSIIISIRNTGTVGAMIKTVYVYKSDTLIRKFDSIDTAYSAGELKDLVNLMPYSPLQVASAYSIRVVTDIGFSVKGTYYTPNTW